MRQEIAVQREINDRLIEEQTEKDLMLEDKDRLLGRLMNENGRLKRKLDELLLMTNPFVGSRGGNDSVGDSGQSEKDGDGETSQ